MFDIIKNWLNNSDNQVKVTIQIFLLNQNTMSASDISITSQVKQNYKLEQNPGKINVMS
jgi:hypothetical protein